MYEVNYWLFANAFLTILDVEAVLLLGLHLWLKRKELTSAHLVSLAFLIFLLGQITFRSMYWQLWYMIGDLSDHRSTHDKLMQIFNYPTIMIASLFNMVGLTIIIAVLTWSFKHLWLYMTGIAFVLAVSSIWLVR